jgi:hypothetical protein
MPRPSARRPRSSRARCAGIAVLLGAVTAASASGQCQPQMTAKVLPSRAGNDGVFFDPIALGGDWMFIPNGLYVAPFGGVGIVYTYRRGPDGTWTPGPELLDPGEDSPSLFGTSLAIEGDRAAIGVFSYYEEFSAGAYVFSRQGDDTWTPEGRIAPDEPYVFSHVNIDGFSGGTILVSAIAYDPKGEYFGGLYTFTRNAQGNWEQEQVLLVYRPRTGMARGAISGDRIVIGTIPMNGSAAELIPLRRSADGIWEPGEAVSLPDAEGIAAGGARPLLEGSTLAVEAHYATKFDNFSRINLYRLGADGLALEATVAPGYSFTSPRFTVTDGLLLVGRPLGDDYGQYAGAVDLFAKAGGQWTHTTTFTPPDNQPGDRFGWPLALDGNRAAIVAHQDKNDGLRGSAYIFDVGSCAPCGTDCTEDGVLDLFDFLCFLNAFEEGDPYANRDRNESFDLFDVVMFIGEFAAGC